MRSRVFCVLLGLAMGWTVAGAPAGASFLHKDSKEPDQNLPPYTTKRVVALQKGTSKCPPVPGWTGERLPDLVRERASLYREDDEQEPDRYGRPIQALADKGENKISAKLEPLLQKYGLDRFCVYTATDQAKAFPRQPQSIGLERADPDRMALVPTAPADLGAVGNQTWPALAGRFLDQVGKVRLAPAKTPGVRLAFVDTHRTGEIPPDPPAPSTVPGHSPSWHGHAMAHLGQEMICGYEVAPENCAVHVVTQLALRYDNYDPNMSFSPDPGNEEGGHLGLVSDLAMAILVQIERWHKLDPGAKLVLNLSVGWDGEQGNDLDAKSAAALETSSELVYDALRIANHLGVLVIASAGNRTGGEKSTSPLLPAAWELHQPSWLPFPIFKVVYAAGGVDGQGLPLPNSRRGGRPQRSAYGDHAVAHTEAPGTAGDGAGEPTKMYTGTSVSAAVISSIAAVAWDLRPDLKPAQVMKLVDQTGEVLDSKADYYWKPLSWLKGRPRLKRLSLCRTVVSLCGPDGNLCHPSPETNACRISERAASDPGMIKPLVPTTGIFTRIDPTPLCDPRTKVFMGLKASITDTDGCPMEKLPDMVTPYGVSTQPPENPCPACTAVPDPPNKALADLALTPNLLASGDTNLQKLPDLVVGLDPDWLQQAHDNQTKLESAIFVVNCYTESKIEERIDITTLIDPLFQSPSPDSVRISFDKIGGWRSLAGCTASVDFKLRVMTSKGPEERSVQSPVYVVP